MLGILALVIHAPLSYAYGNVADDANMCYELLKELISVNRQQTAVIIGRQGLIYRVLLGRFGFKCHVSWTHYGTFNTHIRRRSIFQIKTLSCYLFPVSSITIWDLTESGGRGLERISQFLPPVKIRDGCGECQPFRRITCASNT